MTSDLTIDLPPFCRCLERVETKVEQRDGLVAMWCNACNGVKEIKLRKNSNE